MRRAPAIGTVALLVALLGLSACQASSQVDVNVNRDGGGSVAVTVRLDRSATAATGGLTGQLDTTDLVRAGWTVQGPVASVGGGQQVTVAHSFAVPAQVTPLLASVAGSGPDNARPYRLTVARHQGLLRTRTTLTGLVDLSCGVACFGDSGLTAATGSSVGVDPGPLGADPGRSLTLALAVLLPGRPGPSNATSRAGDRLTWTTPLGSRTAVSASSTAWNPGALLAGVVALVVAALLVAAVLVLVVRRRRRRRRPPPARAARTGGAHVRQGPGRVPPSA